MNIQDTRLALFQTPCPRFSLMARLQSVIWTGGPVILSFQHETVQAPPGCEISVQIPWRKSRGRFSERRAA